MFSKLNLNPKLSIKFFVINIKMKDDEKVDYLEFKIFFNNKII